MFIYAFYLSTTSGEMTNNVNTHVVDLKKVLCCMKPALINTVIMLDFHSRVDHNLFKNQLICLFVNYISVHTALQKNQDSSS